MVAQMPRFNPLKMMRESKSVIGLNMLTLWDAKQSLDELIDAAPSLDRRRQPPPGRRAGVPPRRRAPAAHRYVHERSNVGKVVLTL